MTTAQRKQRIAMLNFLITSYGSYFFDEVGQPTLDDLYNELNCLKSQPP